MASNPEIGQIEKRQDRMEDAIERLTQISYDLNKMLAVHDQRLTQQEKNYLNIERVSENRREEIEAKFEVVFKLISEKAKDLDNDLNIHKEKQTKQLEEIKKDIQKIERIIWTYLGGFSVIIFVLSYGDDIISAFKNFL